MVWGFGGDLGGKNNTASQGWGLGNLLADANDGGRRENFANNVLEFVKAGQSPGAESAEDGDAGTGVGKYFSGASGTQGPDGWISGWSPSQRLQSNEVYRVKSFVDAGKAASSVPQRETNGQTGTIHGEAQTRHEGQAGDSNGTTHSGKLSWVNICGIILLEKEPRLLRILKMFTTGSQLYLTTRTGQDLTRMVLSEESYSSDLKMGTS